MNEYTLGELIEQNRELRNISKSRLCRGLCSITALNRYEQDLRMPDKVLVDALLERLGISSFRYEFMVSECEFECSMLRSKIEEAIWKNELAAATELLEQYRENIRTCEELHKQYADMKLGEIAKREKKYVRAAELLKDALCYTKCEVILEQGISDMLLTNNEMEILYELAEVFYEMGENKKANFLFREMKEYIVKMKWDDEKKRIYYPHILYRLAEWEEQEFNFGLANGYLTEASEIMVREFEISELYEVLTLRRRLMLQMEQETDVQEEKFLKALEIIRVGAEGRITEEGMRIWENIENQQL